MGHPPILPSFSNPKPVCRQKPITLQFGQQRSTRYMPNPTQQNPKHSIPGSQARARMFSFEHAQLLTWSKNLKTEIVSKTDKGTEKAEC
jgi:hypothetical protein